MRSHQGEAVEVLLDVLHRDAPPLHRVAALAIGSKLAPMNIGVTIGALGARVGKHQVGVTLPAGYAFVHPAQRKAGFIVVKFGDVADRLPGGKRVAVLAGHIQIAVRAARRCHALR